MIYLYDFCEPNPVICKTKYHCLPGPHWLSFLSTRFHDISRAQSRWQWCCRRTCQIAEKYGNFHTKSCGFLNFTRSGVKALYSLRIKSQDSYSTFCRKWLEPYTNLFMQMNTQYFWFKYFMYKYTVEFGSYAYGQHKIFAIWNGYRVYQSLIGKLVDLSIHSPCCILPGRTMIYQQ